MHTFVARVISAAAAATILALPAASLASGGAIRFYGAITENSCTVSVGASAADESFHIALSDCTAGQTETSGDATPVNVQVEGDQVLDPATGTFISTGTGHIEVSVLQISARAFTCSLIYP